MPIDAPPSVRPAARVATRPVCAAQRIVINGRFISRPVTGVERYAREIIRAVDGLVTEEHAATAGLRFVLAVPAKANANLPLQAIPTVPVGRLSGYAWEQIELPLFARRDPIINLCNLSPVLSARSITCVHDAHTRLLPQNYSAAFRLAYRILQPLSLRRSARWVTVSRCSGQNLVALGVASRPPDAITPNGADHALRWSAARSGIDPASLPACYVLALGSRSPNKNFALVGRLAERLAPRGIGVVIAGGSDARVFNAGQAVTAANVIELGRVSDDGLALLYSRARAFIFPSLQEGFGLPPIEAMLLGCPVVASNTSAMPEVLGNAALLCDPTDPAEWIAAITRLCSDEMFRQSLIESGRARAARYTWRSSALAILRLVADLSHEAAP